MTAMSWLPAIFSILVGAAGWFYMFYSKAAENLAGVEAASINRLRIRLRRIGAAAMIVLAAVFYIGCVALEQRRPAEAAGYLLAVLVLMGAIVALGLVDLRLTQKLRRSQRK